MSVAINGDAHVIRSQQATLSRAQRSTRPEPRRRAGDRVPRRRSHLSPVPTGLQERVAPGGLGKRIFDVSVVLATAPVWLPVVGVLAAVVRCTSRGPAFYTHERLGQHGVPFACAKLRTMRRDADAILETVFAEHPHLRDEYETNYKLRDDPRVTRIGRFLRKTGLDELPQLTQILRGNMSLVGPRPIVAAEAAYFGPDLHVVHAARPGLTGLWQVSGRSDTTYERRVHLDVEYVRTRTMRSDLKIVGRTITIMARPSTSGGY